jgi:Protein of unknown function (DUF3617)
MKIVQWTTACVLATAAPALWAQKLAPGLWENTTTMQGQGAEAEAARARMQEQMSKMPPEQRKMMEQMMAKQGAGGGLGAGGVMDMMAGKPTTMRVCITPEQAARDFVPPLGSSCKVDSTDRDGKTLRMKISCGGNPISTTESEVTFASDRAYSGKAVVNTVDKGKARRMDIAQVGRWLAADCGSVKPLGTLPMQSAPGAAGAPPAPQLTTTPPAPPAK